LRTVRAEAFHFDLKGSGHFPLRGAPEVIWAGVEASDALSSLRNRVEAALTRAGLPPEGRKFHPHVTLARVKDAQEQDIAAWQALTSLFRIPDVPVREFHLVSSVLKPQGAEHTVEATYALSGMLDGEPM
jgi:RNA 2',3'-cyclic 3'-phosphodiesterase